MKQVYSIIKRPLLTEKSSIERMNRNRFFFEVDIRATKKQIKEAVKKLFNVTPVDVRTMIVRGKTRYIGRTLSKKPNWKKAIVTLKQGEHIDIFERT
jgi:large subunit ribosomal protein L23